MTLDGEALVFARCIGFIFKAPGFSQKQVSPFIRASFAVVLTALIAPSVKLTINPGLANFAFIALGEVVIGATIGMAASILYAGIDAGGAALDDFVGIKGVNPAAGPMTGVGFGRLWSYFFTTAFFIFGGYTLPLAVFADGLRQIPPGAMFDPQQWQLFVYKFPTLILEAALLIAGPAYVIGMVAQFGLGAISRVVPRFSTQNISFGVTYAVVLMVTIVALPLTGVLAAHPWIPMPLPGIANVHATSPGHP